MNVGGREMTTTGESVNAQLKDLQYRDAIAKRIRAGANWFYWIAALSVVNTISLVLFKTSFNFVIGLGITQFADILLAYVAPQNSEAGFAAFSGVVAIIIYPISIGLFLLMGWLALRGKRTVFLIGMGVYVLDAFLQLLFHEYVGMAFHALAVFGMFRGMLAFDELNRIEKEKVVESPESLVPKFPETTSAKLLYYAFWVGSVVFTLLLGGIMLLIWLGNYA
jgi:hypothetical protein